MGCGLGCEAHGEGTSEAEGASGLRGCLKEEREEAGRGGEGQPWTSSCPSLRTSDIPLPGCTLVSSNK